jgi:hypothetical protein
MSFDDIGCHVWAIDGYDTNATAHAVNNNYVAVANKMLSKNKVADEKQDQKTLDGNLAELVQKVQTASNSRAWKDANNNALPIAIYGLYRPGQAAPEHMWMSFDGYTYETMPNQKLCVVKGQKSELERDWKDAMVAKVSTFMTENQRNYLVSAGYLQGSRTPANTSGTGPMRNQGNLHNNRMNPYNLRPRHQ